MESIELVLLILAYTVLIITIFVSFLCYRRSLETWETIFFGVSLLMLIVSLTVSLLLEQNNNIRTISVFVLLSMIIVGVATPLNVMSERQHKIPTYYKKLLYIISTSLLVLTLIAYFINKLNYIEYIIISFLGVSVILSMVLIRITKPRKSIVHREKIEQIFAVIFLIFIPI